MDVHNPAVGSVIAKTPLSTRADLDAAVQAAARAFPAWRDTPVVQRARSMFRFVNLLEQHAEEIARTVTTEHGKTIDESRGSVRRGIECVEVACGAPSLMMGYGLEQIATNVDSTVFRQPLGVVAAITPFNFPAMVPLWFLPFAVATGNCIIVKPSEQVPLSTRLMFRLLEQCDIPPGVVSMVNGGREIVEGICDHPGIRAVSFVGSTPVARAVYQRGTHAGKRVQALGGAKNFVIVMPDANFEKSIEIITESFYGCAGERCLAGSVLVPVGEAHKEARDRLVEAARSLKVGDGMEPGVQMGPVISGTHRERVRSYIDKGVHEGAKLVLDGRGVKVADRDNGFFLGPTVFDEVSPKMTIGHEEIFGPVASIHARQDARRGDRADGVAPQRQRDLDLHLERQERPRVRAPRDGLDGGREHRRGRADGVLPVRRLARQLLRRPQGPRPRRLRVLHRQEGHDHALVVGTRSLPARRARRGIPSPRAA